MRRFVQSAGYVRVRAVAGLVMIALGATVVVRTVETVGVSGRATVPIIAGLLFVAAGLLRLRDFVRLRRNSA